MHRQIVLIDDDSTTNFLNKMIIQKADLVDEIVMFAEAQEALIYFKEHKGLHSLILLDINMPAMDGWEFLEQYAQIENNDSLSFIVMLTSSIDPVDKQKAQESEQVVGYRSKPLSIDILKKLVDRYLN